MLAKTSQLEVSRRVAAYFLMFGLAAITCLVVEVIVVSKAVVESRTEARWLARLDQVANATRSSFAHHGETEFQQLLDGYHSRWGLAYAALVSNEGSFLAHTTSSRVGQRRIAPKGVTTRWGDVRRVRFAVTQGTAAKSQPLSEYQIPIRERGEVRALLVMAPPDPGFWNIVLAVVRHSPVAFLFPILLLVGGAMALRRTVRPLGEVESQLQQVAAAASLSEGQLHRVETPGLVAAGWNRLIGRLGTEDGRGNLDARLDQALDGYRQKKSEHILNSLSDGVAVTDENGVITFANKALSGLLGLGTMVTGEGDQSICGKTMKECLAIESGSPHGTCAAAGQLLDPKLYGRTVVVEMGRSGDMSQGVLRIARSPQFSLPGESPGGHVWSVRDITQQKLADQMRDQFVNAATHELRTPLANIKAYAETLTLSEMMEVEQQKDFCNTINQEVTRLARFVDDLLHLSRMEVGSTSLNEQITDTDRLLNDTIQRARPQMEKKNITFDIRLPEKLPELMLDKDKIIVALVNLLGNAAKYTPEGGFVRMHVEVSDEVMQIDVEDNGIGISVEELPKVLDKFFRSSDPRVRDQTGSGLGLSLTNEIIRLHGGKLTVHSELNKGSKFTVTLPMAPEGVICSSA